MRRSLISLIFLLVCGCLCAQDIQYSQFFANPLYLNPAFTGVTPDHRVSINHRIQWPSLPKAFANYSVSYDYNAENLNSGFGLLVNADRAGSANLGYTSAAFNYSYTVNFDRVLVFKPAITFGYVNRTIDYDKLVFGDQIEFGIDGAPSQDPVLGDIDGVSYFDVGTGFLVYNKYLWGGASAFHLNEPNTSLIQGDNRLPVKWTVHAGARFQIGNTAFKDLKRASMAPGLIYKSQGEFRQLDIGSSFHYAPIIFGLWYRGIPFKKPEVAGQINHDAIILVFGVEFNRFEFGYSYDINISRLSTDSGGAHEFSLQYFFEIRDNPKKVDRRKKFLPCPAFIDGLYN